MMFTFKTDAKFDEMVRLVARIRNPDSAQVRDVTNNIRSGFAANFASESSAKGAWPALAPSTVRDRIREGYGGSGPMRVRTGRGKAGFTQRGHSDHYESVRTIAEGCLYEVGSTDEVVSLRHETGTSRMPARPVVPLTTEFERRILLTIEQSIQRMERNL